MSRIPPASKRREQRRKRLYRQQGGICAGCKQPKKIEEMTFDHVLPQSRSDRRKTKRQKRDHNGLRHVDDYRNIELLCRPCNAMKADHYPWDWSKFVWDPYTRSLKTVAEVEGFYDKDSD